MITFDLAAAAMIFVAGMITGLTVAVLFRDDDEGGDGFYFA